MRSRTGSTPEEAIENAKYAAWTEARRVCDGTPGCTNTLDLGPYQVSLEASDMAWQVEYTLRFACFAMGKRDDAYDRWRNTDDGRTIRDDAPECGAIFRATGVSTTTEGAEALARQAAKRICRSLDGCERTIFVRWETPSDPASIAEGSRKKRTGIFRCARAGAALDPGETEVALHEARSRERVT